jgi:predicted DNA-binding protein (MmcQ/YjbR family)/GNAT superfamily N-acetyltransferase
MNFEFLRSFCLGKPDSSETYPFDEHSPVYKVAGKIFAIASPEDGTVNLKYHSQLIPALMEQYSAVQPGYHMNKQHWITVQFDGGDIKDSILCSLIDESYSLILQSLPRRQRIRHFHTCSIISHGSEHYKQAVDVRYKVLRQPLRLNFTPEQLQAEQQDIHIAAVFENQVIGCLILSKYDADTVKMRQVAVSPRLQGVGIGHSMVLFSEQEARRLGYTRIILHARATAVPFYLSMDYQIISDEFMEVGIPHFAMEKQI